MTVAAGHGAVEVTVTEDMVLLITEGTDTTVRMVPRLPKYGELQRIVCLQIFTGKITCGDLIF